MQVVFNSTYIPYRLLTRNRSHLFVLLINSICETKKSVCKSNQKNHLIITVCITFVFMLLMYSLCETLKSTCTSIQFDVLSS